MSDMHSILDSVKSCGTLPARGSRGSSSCAACRARAAGEQSLAGVNIFACRSVSDTLSECRKYVVLLLHHSVSV